MGEIKRLNMKAIINLPKEVIDFFDKFGVRCDEQDGSRYYNNNQWLRVDASGVVTTEDYQDLPDSVKAVQLKYINQPDSSLAAQQSRQESIAFAEWIVGNRWETSTIHKSTWFRMDSDERYTTEQLFELYKLFKSKQ